MDYSAVINLVLVTVFFSTILAPSLKKVGEIKDDVAKVDFPVIDKNDDESTKERAEKGIELSKKLTQYEDKYNETKRFLRYFYLILSIIVGIQLVIMITNGSLLTPGGMVFIGTVLVIFIVTGIIRSYMTKPSEVRSIQWLAAKGIAKVHANALFQPKLSLNSGSANIMKDDEKMTVGIRSNVDLNGYGYIFTIESKNYKKLYALGAGFIGGHSSKTKIAFANGETGSEINLAKVGLNPGDYVVRLIFVAAAYDGNYRPGETVMPFTVHKKGKGSSTPPLMAVDIGSNSSGLLFTIKNKSNRHKIIHIECAQSFEGDNNVSFIFSSPRLTKYLRKGHRPIAFFSKNGDIDRYDLNRHLALHRLALSYILRLLKRRLKFRGALILINRNPKSRLNIS